MGRVGEKIGLDFVVSTGDNFYDNGLFSEYDPNFKESFSDIYTASSLQKQWYSGIYIHKPFVTFLFSNQIFVLN